MDLLTKNKKDFKVENEVIYLIKKLTFFIFLLFFFQKKSFYSFFKRKASRAPIFKKTEIEIHSDK